jgi:Uma2 family endonuclease
MTAGAEIPERKTSKPTSGKDKIPEYLIKETIDGIPFYYAGFRSVLNKTKTKTDIMADSGLQTDIKAFFMILLAQHIDLKEFKVYSGEVGSHIDHRSNLALDVVVYDKKVLTADKLTTKYLDVTPKIVIEVDVRVELEDKEASVFDDFVLRKVRKLLEFGTEKIIWVFTKSKTIIVATPDNTWKVHDIDQDVEIMEGLTFNLARYFEQEGISWG